jgi:hypothetical protein
MFHRAAASAAVGSGAVRSWARAGSRRRTSADTTFEGPPEEERPSSATFGPICRTVTESMSASVGPRMARRRAKLRRARLRAGLATSMIFVCLFSLSPMGVAQAAPPGSLAITSVGCYPAISVDIRVSLLAGGGSKSNVLHLEWSDGTTTTTAPDTSIPQDSYANSSQSDIYHVDWVSEPTSTATPFVATANATLSWLLPNGNAKDVASTTVQLTCGL